MKLAVRYTVMLWAAAASVFVIAFTVTMELDERKHPTPHEWGYFSRASLRLAQYTRAAESLARINWSKVIAPAREAVRRLESPDIDGKDLVRIVDRQDPSSATPNEFCIYDVTAKSEEWRRGYFEALMLLADSSQHVEGWLRDKKLHVTSPPEYVVGPSNPHPTPLPPGFKERPHEEDCVSAFPSAEDWFVKILATTGFTARQRIEASLAYANFLSFMRRPEEVEPLLQLALAEATPRVEEAKLPYNKKTFVLNDKAGPPSANVLDVLTKVALHKVRDHKDSTTALPILLSILKARRGLSNVPPLSDPKKPANSKPLSRFDQMAGFLSPPPYPPPPSDGTQPPWRSTEERCQEASLHIYIGEILFATSSRVEGLAWTRDAVDSSEEELRSIDARAPDLKAKQVCRDCLRTSLENWSKMVSTLAKEEKLKKESGTQSSTLSFWSGSQEVEGRWEAEQAVVDERINRTLELVEDLQPPAEGLMKFFKV